MMKFKVTNIERKIIKTEKEYNLNPFIGEKFVSIYTSNQHNYSFKIKSYSFDNGGSDSLVMYITILDKYSFSSKLNKIVIYLNELEISKEKNEYHVTHKKYSNFFKLYTAIITNDFKYFKELTKKEFLKDIEHTFEI